MNKFEKSEKIDLAFERVEKAIAKSQNQHDLDYYKYHEKRFRRMAEVILSRVEVGSEVLNVGGHYMHSSIILSALGYKVFSTDVKEFWEVDFIQQRVSDFNIDGCSENNLEHFECLMGVKDKYDVILFTEILEHITFNPIKMWERLYHSAKPSALIYLTTPNSLSLPNLTRTLLRAITLKGVGLKIESVFTQVTYGHHWKEYSSGEIKEYFNRLSDDFYVSTSFFSYNNEQVGRGFSSFCWNNLMRLGNFLYYFSSDIEAIISIEKSNNPFKLQTPAFV